MADKQPTKGALTNIQLAGQVARDVELESVILRSSHLETHLEETVALDELAVEQQFRPRHELLESPRRIRVFIAFKLDLLTRVEPQRGVLQFVAEYALEYRLPEGKNYSDLALHWFAELNGTLNVWPYWREHVHSVVARVGLGSLTLPVWRAKPQAVDATKASQG